MWPHHTGNWNRWDNDLGTLNLISPEKVLDAVACVSYGIVVPCSMPLTDYSPLNEVDTYSHVMKSTSKSVAGGGVQACSDQISVAIHGMVNTHIDGLCHVGFNGQGFNGVPFNEVANYNDGAVRGAITNVSGYLTRGILIDIPLLRGEEYVKPGDCVRKEEVIDLCNDLQPGDALLIRTGRWSAPPEAARDLEQDPHGVHAGIHPDCMEMVARKDIAFLGSDGPNDCFPSPIKECPLPIHVLSLTYWGIHLIHNMNLDNLAKLCAEKQKYTFLFCVAPLNVPGGTGSPLTPLAVL